MSKKIKEFELVAMRTALHGVKDCVLIEPIKVDAATDYDFRRKLRVAKVRCAMVKNTIAKKVLAENGVNSIDKAFSGTTLLCWGGDSVKGLATTVDTAIKESKKDPKSPDKYKVKTAVADGQAMTLEVAKTIPTRLEAIGSIVSALTAPGANLAAALSGPASQIASILKTIEEKQPAEETKPVEPPAA